MIVEQEMFLGVDGKKVVMEMIECQMTVSSVEVMQRLERSVDRRRSAVAGQKCVILTAAAQAVANFYANNFNIYHLTIT